MQNTEALGMDLQFCPMISMPRRYLALRVICLSPHSLLINVIVL